MKYLGMALLCLIIIIGCEKDETHQVNSTIEQPDSITPQGDGVGTSSDYFKIDFLSSQNQNVRLNNTLRSSDPIIDLIQQDMEAKDHHHNFLSKIIRKYGYPLWDFAIKNTAPVGFDFIYIIPYAKENDNGVSSILYASMKNGNLYYKFIDKKKIDKDVRKEKGADHIQPLSMYVYCIYYANYKTFHLFEQDYIDYILEYMTTENNARMNPTYRTCEWMHVCVLNFDYEGTCPVWGPDPNDPDNEILINEDYTTITCDIDCFWNWDCSDGTSTPTDISDLIWWPTEGGGGSSGESPDDPFADIHTNNEYAQNLEDLEFFLETNPIGLLQDCNHSQWSDLVNFTPPSNVTNTLNNLPYDGWSIQTIENASGTAINLDYFGVTINTLPFINGQQLTIGELFEYIRKNINDFLDPSIAEFVPYTPVDLLKWNSTNPVTTLFTIEMDDDGSVICSDYKNQSNSSDWIFTTMKTPGWFSDTYPEDGFHPVSGNRQFGYKTNVNNSYTIFTRGADRLTNFYHNWFAGIAFNGADNLWTSFISNIRSFVNSNQGNASSNYIIEKHRPDWDDVRDVLYGEKNTSDINCSNN